jgi:hypothetical protein
MNQQIIKQRVDLVIKNFVAQIADQYSIDYEDLIRFTKVDAPTARKPPTCLYKRVRGANKGTFCPKTSIENGYCADHQKQAGASIFGTMATPNATAASNTASSKAPSKTQLKLLELLNTAVPQQETVLKKCSKGLIHEETEIIFNHQHLAIGKQAKTGLDKLNSFDIEICERYGWMYDEEAVIED